MSIDITVNETIETVDITANLNVIEVNITRQSGGGGAVNSVNGQTGIVVLDATDVGAYTTSEVDTLLNDKFDNPTGDNTQYLDGTGTPVTFPTIPSVTNLVPYTGATQNVDLGEYQIKAGQFELDQTPTGTAGVAVTRWNNTIGSTETTLKGGNVVLKNGVDLVARVVNKVTPNTTLTKAAYQAVRVTGAQGQRLAVAYAQANNDNNSADTIGLVCETISTNQEGFIITVGQLEGINTTGSLQGETWNDGDVLYLSPTTAGAITNVKPTGATGHIVVIGYVEYSHANNGKIYVKVMNGWELDELHNVNITSVANNQILAYTSASSLWENKSVETALGFTPENVANKSDSFTNSSSITFASTKALVDGLATKRTIVFKKNTNSTAVTGTTSESILEAITIPANTFFVGDIIYFLTRIQKTGTAGVINQKIRISNTNNFATALVLAINNPSSANTFIYLERDIRVKSGNVFQVLANGQNAASDKLNIGASLTTLSIDPTQIIYIWISVQLGSTADSAVNTQYQIEKI